MTHLSLFSGIGGLDLAAEWAGFETIGQCEFADYPTKVLEKHWPDVPRWRDIRTLTGGDFYAKTGRRTVDIISGGFPCQPFSVAGKQRGKEDDRFLWPEMVRVIKELRPTWVIGENVAGIIRLALDDVLFDLEGEGYTTRTFLIPACGVGAPHQRYRTAIVGYSEHNGLFTAKVSGGIEATGGREQEGKNAASKPARTGQSGNLQDVADPKSYNERGLSIRTAEESTRSVSSRENIQYPDSAGCKELYITNEPDKKEITCRGCNEGNVCNSAGKGFPDRRGQQVGGSGEQEPEFERSNSHVPNTDLWEPVRRTACTGKSEETGREQENHERGMPKYAGWEWWAAEPSVGRVAHGISARVDRLKCLGNAVVPQQFYPIFKAIAQIMNNSN